jgi:ribosome modulation factor
MAILIDSAKGKGFLACEKGLPLEANPYQFIETISQWYEWGVGWQTAYNMNKFGIKE